MSSLFEHAKQNYSTMYDDYFSQEAQIRLFDANPPS